MNMYLPYLNSFFDMMEDAEKSWDQKIEDIKREYFEVTVNLPRKKRKNEEKN